jgi:hypothetical protein
MFYDKLNSTAIKQLTVDDNDIQIVYNSSDRVYRYFINNEEFVDKLQTTIVKEESIGKLINQSIKDNSIEEITTTE